MQTLNTFINGLNTDSSYANFPENSFVSLTNGKLGWDSENEATTLSNVKGNLNLTDVNGNTISTDITNYTLIGYCLVKEDYILFYKHTAGIIGRIYKLKQINENSFENLELIYQANLSFGDHIRAVGRYESQDVQKIYWVDLDENYNYKNPVRFLNVAVPTTIDINSISILPEALLDPLTWNNYTSGNLISGSIQYAYRLITEQGVETNFSILSDIYYLTLDNFTQTIFKGSPSNIDTGKGIALNLYIPLLLRQKYKKIEVISLHYSTNTDSPVIKSLPIMEIQIDITTYFIVDTGNDYVNTLTADEYLITKNPIYSKTIVSKDNRLFLGNIKEEVFWTQELEDWDSRVYRYKTNQTTYVPDINNVPITADVINPYNNLNNDGDTNYEYKYASNGTQLGATGINIGVNFLVKQVLMDIDDGNASYARKLTPNLNDLSDSLFTQGTLKGFQRDEIYRFGIIFFNSKGQSSFVKWIADIRMPNFFDIGTITSEKRISGTLIGTQNSLLYPIFTVRNNLPTDVKGFQIVYAKREEWDKTVLTQGLGLGFSVSPAHDLLTTVPMLKSVNGDANTGTLNHIGVTDSYTPNAIQLISPYTTLNNNFNIGDRLDLVSTYSSPSSSSTPQTADTGNGYHRYYTTKLRTFSIIPVQRRSIVTSQKVPIEGTTIVGTVGSGGLPFWNIGYSYGQSDWRGSGATTHVIEYSTQFDNLVGDFNYGYFYVRKVFYPYGGGTYSARQNSVYIPASTLYSNIEGNVDDWFTVNCFYGDTMINYYEHLRVLTPAYETSGTDQNCQEWVYIPIESTYNLPYRNDYNSNSKALNQSIPEPSASIENIYKFTDYTWVSEDNLYKLNPAYNRGNVTNTYVPKPDEIQLLEEPTKVKYSNYKYDNETIDNWMKFLPNNFNTANSNYGSITHLIEILNNIYCVQEHGINLMSINRQEVLSSSNGIPTSLGKGGILDRFDYLNTEIGCPIWNAIIRSLDSFYFINNNTKKAYKVSQQGLISFSDYKNVSTLFKSTIDDYSYTTGIYDKNVLYFTVKNKYPNYLALCDVLSSTTFRLLFNTTGSFIKPYTQEQTYNNTYFRVGNSYIINNTTYKVISIGKSYVEFQGATLNVVDNTMYNIYEYIKTPNEFTITFNNQIEIFEGIHDMIPDIYLRNGKSLLTYLKYNSYTSGITNNNELWQHYIGTYGKYYNGSIKDLTLEFIVNADGKTITEINNLEWLSECTKDSVDQEKTIEYILVENSYQQSDSIKLIPPSTENDVAYTESINIPEFNAYSAGTYNKYQVVKYGSPSMLYISLKDNNTELPSNNKIDWEIYPNYYNIRRKLREWTTIVPRILSTIYKNKVNGSDVDIINYNRMRDFYIRIRVVFKNNYDKKFLLHHISTNFEVMI